MKIHCGPQRTRSMRPREYLSVMPKYTICEGSENANVGVGWEDRRRSRGLTSSAVIASSSWHGVSLRGEKETWSSNI